MDYDKTSSKFDAKDAVGDVNPESSTQWPAKITWNDFLSGTPVSYTFKNECGKNETYRFDFKSHKAPFTGDVPKSCCKSSATVGCDRNIFGGATTQIHTKVSHDDDSLELWKSRVGRLRTWIANLGFYAFAGMQCGAIENCESGQHPVHPLPSFYIPLGSLRVHLLGDMDLSLSSQGDPLQILWNSSEQGEGTRWRLTQWHKDVRKHIPKKSHSLRNIEQEASSLRLWRRFQEKSVSDSAQSVKSRWIFNQSLNALGQIWKKLLSLRFPSSYRLSGEARESEIDSPSPR